MNEGGVLRRALVKYAGQGNHSKTIRAKDFDEFFLRQRNNPLQEMLNESDGDPGRRLSGRQAILTQAILPPARVFGGLSITCTKDHFP